MKYGPSLIVLVVTACGPTVVPPVEDTGSAQTGDPSSTMETPPTTATPGDTGQPDDDTGSPPLPTGSADSTGAITSAGFIDDPDGGGADFMCNMFTQNCPPGEKCMPWVNGGGTWNATRCSAVVDDPGVAGEPCTVEGSGTSGIDTCALGVMCWDVDPETLEGVCVDMCIGTIDEPFCDDPDTWCTIGADSVLSICLPRCDPIGQDCPGDEGCYPVNERFTCAPVSGEPPGAPGDPCEFVNVCESGNFCGSPSFNTAICLDQGAVGCCIPFCDLQMPACANGEMCMPWFEPGDPQALGWEHVGFCRIES